MLEEKYGKKSRKNKEKTKVRIKNKN